MIERLKAEIAKEVVGQAALIDALLIALLSEGNILLEGVPGLAKTTTVKALAKASGLAFGRVQFTPDLLPSDIIGAQIYNPQTHTFSVKKGPIFTNLLLADEINRAPAKVQSALLEAMQERQVTIGEESFALPEPFMVLATQNPIEQEGVYPLPEAQLDRFMMKVLVKHNSEDEELRIMQLAANKAFESATPVIDSETLLQMQAQVRAIHVDEAISRYIVSLVSASRDPQKHRLEAWQPLVRYGASPRASIDLYKAAKAHAYIAGRDHVRPEDIAATLFKVLRHRIAMSYEARAQKLTSDDFIAAILEETPIP